MPSAQRGRTSINQYCLAYVFSYLVSSRFETRLAIRRQQQRSCILSLPRYSFFLSLFRFFESQIDSPSRFMNLIHSMKLSHGTLRFIVYGLSKGSVWSLLIIHIMQVQDTSIYLLFLPSPPHNTLLLPQSQIAYLQDFPHFKLGT
jgi:hypothetical protein